MFVPFKKTLIKYNLILIMSSYHAAVQVTQRMGKLIRGMVVFPHQAHTNTHTHSFKFDLFVVGYCVLSPTFSGRSTILIKPAAELATKTSPPIKTAQAWTAE